MKSNRFLRVFVLLAIILSLIPASQATALSTNVPPVGMFQLPWEQGKAWVALDGFDNGTKRASNSPHNYRYGGAVDFAPRSQMFLGEDTSSFWVTAAAAGTVYEVGSCHLKIDHGNGWNSEYQFLGNIQVKVGDAVYRNQRLAVIADGLRQPFCYPHVGEGEPHLHFALRPNMRNATLAGWLITYNSFFNMTFFTKDGVSVSSYRPLMNVLDLQIVLREPLAWEVLSTGTVDAYRYERWPFTLTEQTNFTLTATPTTNGLLPLLLLLDANGNELTRTADGILTVTEPAGNYFVQIQPKMGAGFYTLLLHRNDQPLPTGAYVLTEVMPTSINLGGSSLATVSLKNVPTEGYKSTEFTCTYDSSLAEISGITPTELFGPDPVMAVNGPQNGTVIVAIAGSKGSKAITSGAAFTFNIQGLQAGQTSVECTARISKGDNILTAIDHLPAILTILGSAPTPLPTSTPITIPPTPEFTVTPEITVTPSPTLPPSDWLTFTNSTYRFEFKYPAAGQIATGGTDAATRINLPFAPGTNLSQKYLDMIVTENANPCQSPLATSSILATTETVTINGLTFLKQTGGDGSAGHINKWTAYSTGGDSVCVSLDFVLRTANPDVYATPPVVYDEAAETGVFEQIVTTYAWLGLPTPTPSVTSEPPTPEASPTPFFTATPTALPTTGILTGKVYASKPVTIGLYAADNALVASVVANSDGTFSLEAPAGTYTIVLATASGFLDAQGAATLLGGQTSAMPVISLLAGDIDGNKIIDQFDALTIGMNYNGIIPAAADLNNDGIINVLDLEMLARSYRKAGPVAWQ